MKVSNGFKRLGINAEAAVDGIRSRYNGIGEAICLALHGGLVGGFFGALLGAGVSVALNQKTEFVEDSAEYQSLNAYTNMPNSCDSGGEYYFAAKGPNGHYSLYKHNSPASGDIQNKKQMERFAEDFKECLDDVKSDPDMQADWKVLVGYQVSQPLRTQDTNQTAPEGQENFRAYRSLSDSEAYSLPEWQEVLGSEVNALSELQNQWADALDDFKSGDIYDHANDKNVQTMDYEDDYAPYYWRIAARGALSFGLLGFAIGLFGRKPSSEYHEREKNRDERRAALAHDNFKF
jgi:hypothetical protein